MKNLRLLSLAGLFVICCTENVSSTGQTDKLVQEIVDAASSKGSYDQIYNQIDQCLRTSSYSIDQHQEVINWQNQEGKTPLHVLLYQKNVEIDHVVALLKFKPTILIKDGKGETPLYAAAAIKGNQKILELLLTKILVDYFRHNRPYDPEPYTAADAYFTGLKDELCRLLKSSNYEELEKAFEILGKAPQSQTRQEFTKLLKAYSYANNFGIKSSTKEREDLRQFDIDLHFTTSMLENIINKNLLHLAVDRENTELVECICSQINNPWVLYRLSRAPGTWISPIYNDNDKDKDDIKKIEKIKNIINNRLWTLCSIGGSALAILGFIGSNTAGFYLRGKVLEKT